MKAVELLRAQSEMAFEDLKQALDGVTERRAWAMLPQVGPEHLNTDGSIHGITLHIASCKFIYGSIAFRNVEVRWRDCAARIEAFEPAWVPALEYLDEAQNYWLSSWAGLSEDDLEREVPHFSGKLWPAWKTIRMVIHHDAYHAGQIAMLRFACPESDKPPLSAAADIRQYCSDLPSW